MRFLCRNGHRSKYFIYVDRSSETKTIRCEHECYSSGEQMLLVTVFTFHV